VVIAGVVIASAVEPIIRRLGRHRVNRILAVVLVYVIIAAVVGLILIFFVPMVVNDTASFLKNIPPNISIEKLWSPIRDISTTFGAPATSTGLGNHTLS